MQRTFEHQFDGLPVSILPEPPDERGRLLVWMAGDEYRVNPDYLKPLNGTYSADTEPHTAGENDDTEEVP